MSTTPPNPRTYGHGTNTSDLDLDGVPAAHRHAVRALRKRLDNRVEGVSIDRVVTVDNADHTRVYLDDGGRSADLLSVHDLRTALADTGVETVDLRVGGHTSILLDWFLGFEV